MKKMISIIISVAMLITVFSCCVSAQTDTGISGIEYAERTFFHKDFSQSGSYNSLFSNGIGSWNEETGTLDLTITAGGSTGNFSGNISPASGAIVVGEMIVTPNTSVGGLHLQMKIGSAIKTYIGIRNGFFVVNNSNTTYSVEVGHIYDMKVVCDQNQGTDIKVIVKDLTDDAILVDESIPYVGTVSRYKIDTELGSESAEFSIHSIAVFEAMRQQAYKTVEISGKSSIAVGENIKISLTPKGGIPQRAEIYQNNQQIAVLNETPFEYTVENLSIGMYEFYAKLYFEDGSVAVSEKHPVVVSEVEYQEVSSLAETTLSVDSAGEATSDWVGITTDFKESEKNIILIDSEFSFDNTTGLVIIGELRAVSGDTTTNRILLSINNGEMYFYNSAAAVVETGKTYKASMKFDTMSGTLSGVVVDENDEIVTSVEDVPYNAPGTINRIKFQQSKPTEGIATTNINSVSVLRQTGSNEIVSLHDEDGNDIGLKSVDKNIKYIGVDFAWAPPKDVDVCIVENETEIKAQGNYDRINGVYEIVLEDGLKYNSTYKLKVTSSNEDAFVPGYFASFTTTEDDVSIRNLMLRKSNGTFTSNISDCIGLSELTIEPAVENNTGDEINITVIVCLYNEAGTMKNMFSQDINIQANGIYTTPIVISDEEGDGLLSSNDYMVMYIVNNATDLMAISKQVKID